MLNRTASNHINSPTAADSRLYPPPPGIKQRLPRSEVISVATQRAHIAMATSQSLPRDGNTAAVANFGDMPHAVAATLVEQPPPPITPHAASAHDGMRVFLSTFGQCGRSSHQNTIERPGGDVSTASQLHVRGVRTSCELAVLAPTTPRRPTEPLAEVGFYTPASQISTASNAKCPPAPRKRVFPRSINTHLAVKRKLAF